MKNVGLLILMLFASTSAHWINKTELLIPQNQRSGVESEYVQSSASQEMVFTLDQQKTTKWTIHTDQPICTLSIVKGTSIINSLVIDHKKATFKQLMEPGTYKLKTTANARISLYEWRVHKIKAIIPVGGGTPVSLVSNNKTVSYFRAAPDTIPLLKVEGPTKVFVYIRVDVPEKETTHILDVTITDKANGKVISHKTASSHKSKKAVYMDNKSVVPGQAQIITFDVPSGNHDYAITLKDAHGVVKFYAESHKAVKKGSRHQKAIKW